MIRSIIRDDPSLLFNTGGHAPSSLAGARIDKLLGFVCLKLVKEMVYQWWKRVWLMVSLPFDAGTVLGSIPSGEEVAGLELPVFGAEAGLTAEKTKARPTTGVEARDGAPPKKEDPSPFTLGKGLPPVPSKLVKKILKGDFIDMAELLRDNIEAERRRSRASNSDTSSSIPGRWEVPHLFSWIQCFGAYAAVVSSKNPATAGVPDYDSVGGQAL